MSTQTTYIAKIRHILIVDDDAELAATWKTLLETYDFTVSTASNGVEALKLVMHMDVDVILCDLMMPKMPGDMFYTAIERIKPHLCSRFIFVTAYEGHPRFEAFFKRLRQPVILYKPVTVGKLVGTINVIFSRLGQERLAPSTQRPVL